MTWKNNLLRMVNAISEYKKKSIKNKSNTGNMVLIHIISQ